MTTYQENIPPEVLKLLQHRITEESDIPQMEFLFKIFGVPCFPIRELVAVAGKAKSGKTYFLSLLMAASIKDHLMTIERIPRPLKVLWYDTEQSEQSTQDILVNRISSLVSPDERAAIAEHINAFNVRLFSWEERLEMFEQAIPCLKPDLVILDGVRDLLSDINDGKEAQRITEQLMVLAQHNDCCIVCVLHQNKSDSDRNLRGWIGTELTNKVFEVYSCEKLRDSKTFKVEQTHTRKFDLDQELYYKINRDSGLPEISEKPLTQDKMFNRDYLIYHGDRPDSPYEWNLQKLFADALEGKPYKPYSVVMGIAMKLGKIQDAKLYYTLFNMALEKKIVTKDALPQTGQQVVRLCGNELPF